MEYIPIEDVSNSMEGTEGPTFFKLVVFLYLHISVERMDLGISLSLLYGGLEFAFAHPFPIHWTQP